jgi:hypothetical protein
VMIRYSCAKTKFYWELKILSSCSSSGHFFILMGIEGVKRLLLGFDPGDPLSQFYPIIAYVGLAGAVILIDPKAVVKNKSAYIRKGVLEIIAIIGILLLSAWIAAIVKPVIALPQIFFAMMISAALGAILSEWKFGPTLRALLFAGIPVVLGANFIVGGSLMLDAFAITGMKAVMAYGLFRTNLLDVRRTGPADLGSQSQSCPEPGSPVWLAPSLTRD